MPRLASLAPNVPLPAALAYMPNTSSLSHMTSWPGRGSHLTRKARHIRRAIIMYQDTSFPTTVWAPAWITSKRRRQQYTFEAYYLTEIRQKKHRARLPDIPPFVLTEVMWLTTYFDLQLKCDVCGLPEGPACID